MTVPEKVALMLHGTLPGDSDRGFGIGSRYDRAAAASLITSGVNSFITRLSTDPLSFAIENNAIQKIAEQSRLGIPVTISTDPRHHFHEVTGASSRAKGFSQWPEPLGFAALGDERLIEQFGRLAAREYHAVGIQMALSPQADLFTEPRWPRGMQTFGSQKVAEEGAFDDDNTYRATALDVKSRNIEIYACRADEISVPIAMVSRAKIGNHVEDRLLTELG